MVGQLSTTNILQFRQDSIHLRSRGAIPLAIKVKIDRGTMCQHPGKLGKDRIRKFMAQGGSKVSHHGYKPNHLTLRFDMSTVREDIHMYWVRKSPMEDAHSHPCLDGRCLLFVTHHLAVLWLCMAD